MKKYLKLFSNCIPVKGAKRSIICDLQRDDFEFIPNGLYEILTTYDGAHLEEIEQLFPDDSDKKNFRKYIDYLFDKEYLFFTDSPELFPSISLEFHDPSRINNAIIDYNGLYEIELLEKVISDLDKLKCLALELRFFNTTEISELITILDYTNRTGIKSIQILIPYNGELDINSIITQYSRVDRVLMYSCPKEKENELIKNIPIYYQTENIENEGSCGHINPKNFTSNLSLFTEGQSHNTCLNKKISIDKMGGIKNCPSLTTTYGNIRSNSVFDAISNENFRSLWTISKDSIDVCKDCEFRYVCTDCRAYTEGGMYSKPKKCNYDPYIAQWIN